MMAASPVCIEPIVFTCQPPTIVFTTPCELWKRLGPRPKGSSYRMLTTPREETSSGSTERLDRRVVLAVLKS